MSFGNIIILNGTSSSGKTTILKLLQDLLEEPYLDAGIDRFLWMLPRRYINEAEYWHQVFDTVWTGTGEQQELEIKTAPLGYQVISSMHQAAAVISRARMGVLMDHVMLEPEWVLECATLFQGLPAWLVKIHCPLEVVEQRERDRRDRTVGQARAQYYRVHAHGLYDIEVDTSVLNPLECAEAIKERVLNGPPAGALKEILRSAG